MLLMFNSVLWDCAQLALICHVLVPLFQRRRHRTNSLHIYEEETALNRSLSPQNVFTPYSYLPRKSSIMCSPLCLPVSECECVCVSD